MSKKKLSKMDLLIHLIVKVKNDDIFALASQLAYYLVLSFFPFLIFLMTLIGFINLSSTEVLEALSKILPIPVFNLTESIVIEVINSQNTGLLGVSIVLTIWSASSGFRAVTKGVNKAYDIHEERGYIKRSIISFFVTISLALTILLTLGLLVFGNVIGKYIIDVLTYKNLGIILWNILRNGLIILVLIVVFAAIYKFTPCKRLKWREVFPGAVICTLGWLVLSKGFSFYVDNYNNYSRVYGSLAAVFILMIWLFLSSMVFIFGVEVNSVLSKNKIIK